MEGLLLIGLLVYGLFRSIIDLAMIEESQEMIRSMSPKKSVLISLFSLISSIGLIMITVSLIYMLFQ